MTPDPIEALPDEVDEGGRIFSAWYPAPTEEQVTAALQADDPAAALVPEPDDTDSWEKWAVGLLAAGATSVALDAAKSTAWLLVRRALLISTLTDTTRRGVQEQIDLDPSPAAVVRAYGIPATRINTLATDPTRAKALLAERWRLVSEVETTATYAAGAIEAAVQAVADGTLPPGTEIEWNARYTSNICEECAYLDGQRQPPGSPWIGIYGDKYAGPGWHPGCRCGMTIIKGELVQKVSLTAPDSVKAELKRGLKWHEEGHSGDGLKPETVAWARRLADGDPISEQKARDMHAWLARHKVDKEGQGYNPGEDGYPSPGRVAWALWGGDPAIGWSAKLVNYFEDKTVQKRDYNTAERKEMAGKGWALPDGSFPIANEADLMAAMQSIGRAKNPGAAKRHIKRRAKALGLTDKLTPAFQKAAEKAQISKAGTPIKPWETYSLSYDPPDLPIPCTPADLTPTMSAAMPAEMQADFCAIWNALTQPLPTGAGMRDDMAYSAALMLCCENGGWFQQRDGSYVRLVVEGQSPGYEEPETEVEKAGKMLSAANHRTMHENLTSMEKACANLRKMMDESGNAPILDPEGSADMGDGEIADPAAHAKAVAEGKIRPIEKAIPFTISGTFEKVDSEQRIAYGYGIVAKVNGDTVEDSQKDQIVDFESMEKASLNYALSDRAGKLMHKGDAAYSVPFILPMTKTIAKSLGMTIKKEGVIIGMHFPRTPEGDKGWEMAKDGGGFSVGGRGTRTPVD